MCTTPCTCGVWRAYLPHSIDEEMHQSFMSWRGQAQTMLYRRFTFCSANGMAGGLP